MSRWLPSEGKAATHFASLQKEPRFAESMFIEDIHLGIMPIRSSEMRGYSAKFAGSPEDSERALALIRSFQQYDWHRQNEIVASAIHEISRDMAWYGRAAFEIILSDAAPRIRLQSFTPLRLFRLGPMYLQLIPRGDRDFWKRSTSRLFASDVWLISIPKELGGPFNYRRILRTLRRGHRAAPAFWRRDLERGTPTRGFDFLEYRRETEICEARATKSWGWNRRDFSGKNWTEFTLFYRLMTFRWAQATLREHIISELNLLFARLSINAQLQVVGLPSSMDILKLRNEMTEGRISYSKASEISSIS
jgi:hypothetical protein